MTTSEPIQPHITDSELQQHKTVVSYRETDRDLLASLFETFPALPADIAAEFTKRLEQADVDLETTALSDDDINHTVREFLRDLKEQQYDTDAYEIRLAFGRQSAQADIGLAELQAAFHAYTAVVGERLTESRQTPSNNGISPDKQFAWQRCIARAKALDIRAVIEGYQSAREESGVSQEDITSRIQEIKTRQLKPMEASASVVRRGSDEVCDLVGDQTEKTQEMSGEITTLSATVEEVASSAQQVNSVADDAEQTATDGQQAAEDAIEVMEDIEQDSRAVAEDITELETKITEIDEIATVIAEIADQTNMLALNASIEAARAGEAGEGFGVVAEEVKSLAEESQQQATEVEETVDEVQAVTKRTVENLQQTNTRIEQGLTEVERAMEQLEEIVASVSEASAGISEIARATDEQAEMAETVSTMVDEVADRAETIQGEIDKIAAANQEQTDKIENVIDAVDDLAQTD